MGKRAWGVEVSEKFRNNALRESITLGASRGVMLIKLDLQTIVSEFDSH